MPYSVELKKKFVFVHYEGEVTPEESEASSGEVLRFARQSELPRVVIDIRDVIGEPSPQDLRSLMEANAEVTPPRPHTAFIVREDQYARFRFIEDFAVSRGMPIRVFVDEDEALNWLAD